jgi:S1-C subfamily serine protease
MLQDIGPNLERVVTRAVSIHRGLRLEDVSSDLARYFGVEKGVLVVSVPDEDSPLKGGDIILSVGGNDVSSAGSAYRALFESEQSVAVGVYRQGVEESVDVDPDQFGGAGHMIRLHRRHEADGDLDASILIESQ